MANSTRSRANVKRQREFKKALIDEGLTLAAFAKRLDITPFHLTRAFRTPAAVSQRIHAAIDALIEKHGHSTAAA